MVVDLFVVRLTIGGNTNISMMIAEKTAHIIRSRHGLSLAAN
jgi:hypothetical protein